MQKPSDFYFDLALRLSRKAAERVTNDDELRELLLVEEIKTWSPEQLQAVMVDYTVEHMEQQARIAAVVQFVNNRGIVSENGSVAEALYDSDRITG